MEKLKSCTDCFSSPVLYQCRSHLCTSVEAQRIKCSTCTPTGFSNQWPEIRTETVLQNFLRSNHIAGLLGYSEFLPVHQQSLCIGKHDRFNRLQEVFQRILYVVRRINHPAEIPGMIHICLLYSFHQFIKNEKQLIRFYAADGQIIIAI